MCVTAKKLHITTRKSINTENKGTQNLAKGAQLDKKVSQLLLNAILIGESAYAEF